MPVTGLMTAVAAQQLILTFLADVDLKCCVRVSREWRRAYSLAAATICVQCTGVSKPRFRSTIAELAFLNRVRRPLDADHGRHLVCWAAASAEYAPFLHKLLAARPDFANAVDTDDPQPLCIAVEAVNVSAVNLLLLFGARVNICDLDHSTPVFLAAAAGHTKILKLLLGRTTPKLPDYNRAVALRVLGSDWQRKTKSGGPLAPLPWALRRGARVVPRENTDGRIAVRGGGTVAREGAEDDDIFRTVDRDAAAAAAAVGLGSGLGVTPAPPSTAAGRRRPGTAPRGARGARRGRAGRGTGADAREADDITSDGLEEVVDINYHNDLGKTPLLAAVEGGHLRCAFLLLANHVDDLRTARPPGLSAFAHLDRVSGPAHTADPVAAMGHGDAGTSGSSRMKVKVDWSGRASAMNALCRACDAGDAKMVRMLLRWGADPNVEAAGEVTPLFLAANGGHDRVLAVLLEERPPARSSLGDLETLYKELHYIRCDARRKDALAQRQMEARRASYLAHVEQERIAAEVAAQREAKERAAKARLAEKEAAEALGVKQPEEAPADDGNVAFFMTEADDGEDDNDSGRTDSDDRNSDSNDSCDDGKHSESKHSDGKASADGRHEETPEESTPAEDASRGASSAATRKPKGKGGSRPQSGASRGSRTRRRPHSRRSRPRSGNRGHWRDDVESDDTTDPDLYRDMGDDSGLSEVDWEEEVGPAAASARQAYSQWSMSQYGKPRPRAWQPPEEPTDPRHVRIHATNEHGKTALFAAAAAGRINATRLLLLAGCSPHARTSRNKSALYAAVEGGHMRVVKLLLAHSTPDDVHDQTTYGSDAIHVATRTGNKQMKDLLYSFVKSHETLQRAAAEVAASRRAGGLESQRRLARQQKQATKRLANAKEVDTTNRKRIELRRKMRELRAKTAAIYDGERREERDRAPARKTAAQRATESARAANRMEQRERGSQSFADPTADSWMLGVRELQNPEEWYNTVRDSGGAAAGGAGAPYASQLPPIAGGYEPVDSGLVGAGEALAQPLVVASTATTAVSAYPWRRPEVPDSGARQKVPAEPSPMTFQSRPSAEALASMQQAVLDSRAAEGAESATSDPSNEAAGPTKASANEAGAVVREAAAEAAEQRASVAAKHDTEDAARKAEEAAVSLKRMEAAIRRKWLIEDARRRAAEAGEERDDADAAREHSKRRPDSVASMPSEPVASAPRGSDIEVRPSTEGGGIAPTSAGPAVTSSQSSSTDPKVLAIMADVDRWISQRRDANPAAFVASTSRGESTQPASAPAAVWTEGASAYNSSLGAATELPAVASHAGMDGAALVRPAGSDGSLMSPGLTALIADVNQQFANRWGSGEGLATQNIAAKKSAPTAESQSAYSSARSPYKRRPGSQSGVSERAHSPIRSPKKAVVPAAPERSPVRSPAKHSAVDEPAESAAPSDVFRSKREEAMERRRALIAKARADAQNVESEGAASAQEETAGRAATARSRPASGNSRRRPPSASSVVLPDDPVDAAAKVSQAVERYLKRRPSSGASTRSRPRSGASTRSRPQSGASIRSRRFISEAAASAAAAMAAAGVGGGGEDRSQRHVQSASTAGGESSGDSDDAPDRDVLPTAGGVFPTEQFAFTGAQNEPPAVRPQASTARPTVADPWEEADGFEGDAPTTVSQSAPGSTEKKKKKRRRRRRKRAAKKNRIPGAANSSMTSTDAADTSADDAGLGIPGYVSAGDIRSSIRKFHLDIWSGAKKGKSKRSVASSGAAGAGKENDETDLWHGGRGTIAEAIASGSRANTADPGSWAVPVPAMQLRSSLAPIVGGPARAQSFTFGNGVEQNPLATEQARRPRRLPATKSFAGHRRAAGSAF